MLMEMENAHTIKNQKLGVLDILKESLIISVKNVKFLIFVLFSSFPMLLFWIYNESFLQRTLLEATRVLMAPPTDHFSRSWPISEQGSEALSKHLLFSVIQLIFLHTLPFHLLELCTVFVTVDVASKLYTEERPMTLNDMVHKPIRNKKLRRTFITLFYVLFWSTCVVIPLIWFATNFLVVSSSINDIFDICVAEFFAVVVMLMLAKYLEWSAVWNVGIVISILEEKVYGVQALALSWFLTRGGKRQGRSLMLVFFAWGLGLRMACLYAGCGGNGIIVQIGLFCIGNVIKWVACMVYFYDCRKRMVEKQIDEEVGETVKAGDK